MTSGFSRQTVHWSSWPMCRGTGPVSTEQYSRTVCVGPCAETGTAPLPGRWGVGSMAVEAWSPSHKYFNVAFRKKEVCQRCGHAAAVATMMQVSCAEVDLRLCCTLYVRGGVYWTKVFGVVSGGDKGMFGIKSMEFFYHTYCIGHQNKCDGRHHTCAWGCFYGSTSHI